MKKAFLASLFLLVALPAFATDKIRFATEAAYAPFEFVDSDNEFQGFDIDLVRALCQHMQAECTFTNQAFDSLIPALKFKRYDAAISAMDITPARARQVAFTDPYYTNSAAFVTINGHVATQADLEGKRVGVQNGTTYQQYLLERMKGVTAVPYANYQDAFIDMQSGRLDAVFGDNAAVSEWMKDSDKVSYVGEPIHDPDYFGAGFGIAVNRKNQELLTKLNAALAAIRADGEYQRIHDKYFGK